MIEAAASSARNWSRESGGAVGLWPVVTEEHNSAYRLKISIQTLAVLSSWWQYVSKSCTEVASRCVRCGGGEHITSETCLDCNSEPADMCRPSNRSRHLPEVKCFWTFRKQNTSSLMAPDSTTHTQLSQPVKPTVWWKKIRYLFINGHNWQLLTWTWSSTFVTFTPSYVSFRFE